MCTVVNPKSDPPSTNAIISVANTLPLLLFLLLNRYLSRVCVRLPPLDSDERAQLRLSLDAKSLEDALEVIEAAEGEMEVAEQ